MSCRRDGAQEGEVTPTPACVCSESLIISKDGNPQGWADQSGKAGSAAMLGSNPLPLPPSPGLPGSPSRLGAGQGWGGYRGCFSQWIFEGSQRPRGSSAHGFALPCMLPAVEGALTPGHGDGGTRSVPPSPAPSALRARPALLLWARVSLLVLFPCQLFPNITVFCKEPSDIPEVGRPVLSLLPPVVLQA